MKAEGAYCPIPQPIFKTGKPYRLVVYPVADGYISEGDKVRPMTEDELETLNDRIGYHLRKSFT